MCTGSDACRVCCQAAANESCMPLEFVTNLLSDGVPCVTNGVNGACSNVSVCVYVRICVCVFV